MTTKTFLLLALFLGIALGIEAQPTVYFTREISPAALVRVYKALGVTPHGRVAVKISTGEGGNTHYLKPTLIRDLVDEVHGTLVECCTAYGGTRQDVSSHWQTITDHGFDSLFAVDLMDQYDEIRIPVADRKHLNYDIVGGHLANYDFMVNLAHFKGHAMGGFGGVLKNASIGVASTAGKAYIHTAGRTSDVTKAWSHENLAAGDRQDEFLESMAAAAQAVHNYMGGKVVYINVMNNLSVDCDCDGHPAAPELKDMGIVASLDPVAADQACLDMVFNHQASAGDNEQPLIARINRQHGTYITDYAEQIGLGSKKYTLINLDNNNTTMEQKSEALLVANELPWDNAGEGVKRQILGYDNQLMLVKVAFEKGAIGTPHRHPHVQSSYVVSGKFKVTIDGETRTLVAGDGYHVAPNLLHGCVCLEKGMLIDTFTPMRADFLKK